MSERLFSEEFLQRLERLSLAARKATLGQTQGERRSPRRGQSVEFADFRPYTAGDDIRRIDWNAYARLERFFIKLFVEEEDLTVHFLIDASRSMVWGQPDKLNYAARVAGALGYIALASLDRVTVTAVGGTRLNGAAHLPALRGKRQALQFFNYLQTLENAAREAAASAADDPARVLRAYTARPAPLVVLSDLMHDGWQDGLRTLAGRGFEISVVHILAPDEVTPDLEGDFKLLDGEEGAPVEISADYELIARYRHGLAAWQDELRQFCAARSMNYVPVTTSLPLEELLFAWLMRKGVLR